ncbi:heat shock 70 kDa protein 12A-like [Pholidichthys leucotaenia]
MPATEAAAAECEPKLDHQRTEPKKLSSDVSIEDVHGKSMKALKVVTEVLRFLMEDALKTISDNICGRTFMVHDFTWVLTVPDQWGPSGKRFIREAATQAGLVNIVIASESVAASFQCMNHTANGFLTLKHGDHLVQQPGTQLIVLNGGDKCFDVTVLEVLDGGSRKELYKASRNDLGKQTVQRKFKEFLREIFSDGVWEEYETEYPNEVQKMMYEFMFYFKSDDDIQVICPFNLGRLACKQKDIEEFFEKVPGASWDEGFITFSKGKVRSLYDSYLNSITEHVREVLKKNVNTKYILLAGFFSEVQFFHKHIQDQFGNQCEVLCFYRFKQSILQGALMLGRNPALAAFRKSLFTYGINIVTIPDWSTHPTRSLNWTQRGSLNRFTKLVEINEEVNLNESREYVLYPQEDHHTEMRITFYRTKKKNPEFADEDGVTKVSSLILTLPERTRRKNCGVHLTIIFDSSEIIATASDSGSRSTALISMDFETTMDF